jgi:2-keto-4-pentenoate hydratase/2-oxohepta-3-ene-1,7-dioic acid hydratase in catechol pathway
MSFTRLIRFVDAAGKTRFGQPAIASAAEFTEKLEAGSLSALAFEGSDPFSLTATNETVAVKEVLPILTREDVPVIRCIGLNYIKHSRFSELALWNKVSQSLTLAVKEGGRNPPPYPSLFVKPATSLASYKEDIPIPKVAQDGALDYEGELTIVIGKTGKNISQEDALSYVAGYLSANDVSSRKWQRDPAFAGGVPQWCFSKGFDKFLPVSPVLVSPSVVGAADNLRLQTFVNGEVRQDSNTNDLLFGVKAIIEFLSQGTTLEKGTVIVTGTPAGVAMGMKPEPIYLKDGDVVEVRIEELGSTKNKMVYEQ